MRVVVDPKIALRTVAVVNTEHASEALPNATWIRGNADVNFNSFPERRPALAFVLVQVLCGFGTGALESVLNAHLAGLQVGVHAIGDAGNRIVLDTLPKMQEAKGLYRTLRFKEIAPYLKDPTPGAICFELRFS